MILLLYYSFCVVEPKKIPFLSGIIYRAGAGAGTGAGTGAGAGAGAGAGSNGKKWIRSRSWSRK